MKKTGIIVSVSGPLLIAFFILAETNHFPEAVIVTSLFLGLICTGAGPAFILFPLAAERRKKIERRALMFSIGFIALGVFFKMQRWKGATFGLMIGVFILCFFYGSLAFKNKYEKWKVYARSKRDAFFLSLFDFVGIGSFFLGVLFKLLHWPLADVMTTAGLIVLAIGMLAWNQKFKKEVVFRKETEDKLSESHKEIGLQHKLLAEKQKEIIDSINYAKRIQRSHMATEIYIEKSLKRLKRS